MRPVALRRPSLLLPPLLLVASCSSSDVSRIEVAIRPKPADGSSLYRQDSLSDIRPSSTLVQARARGAVGGFRPPAARPRGCPRGPYVPVLGVGGGRRRRRRSHRVRAASSWCTMPCATMGALLESTIQRSPGSVASGQTGGGRQKLASSATQLSAPAVHNTADPRYS